MCDLHMSCDLYVIPCDSYVIPYQENLKPVRVIELY